MGKGGQGPETIFKNQVLAILKKHPEVAEAYVSDTAFNRGRGYHASRPAGLPDITGYTKNKHQGLPARPIYLELKSGAGKSTDAQNLFISKARANGCIAGIIYTIEELWTLLNEYGLGG